MTTVSLIITTYNWEEALEAVLKSVLFQTRLPEEVVIADDGSREETKALVERYQSLFPMPLIHCWQADEGFRLAMSRNRAIAKASSEYLIMIDGDIVMPPSFIDDHIRAAKPGWFIQGGRVQVGPIRSRDLMVNPMSLSPFARDIRNRKNTISNPLLSRLFSYQRDNDAATRGCNMSFWKSDVTQVNGFNEAFEGWGREDSEFVHRMLNSGYHRLYLKFAGAGLHLYHNENARDALPHNDEIFRRTVESKLKWCELGLNQYLKAE